ncbi:hypothetical protein BDV97DRAFT_145354 [Delphinella strobiligena]|nr:hypothetical protein BDV97DRAFT_145354 [Delphinella strobiligena]
MLPKLRIWGEGRFFSAKIVSVYHLQSQCLTLLIPSDHQRGPRNSKLMWVQKRKRVNETWKLRYACKMQVLLPTLRLLCGCLDRSRLRHSLAVTGGQSSPQNNIACVFLQQISTPKPGQPTGVQLSLRRSTTRTSRRRIFPGANTSIFATFKYHCID